MNRQALFLRSVRPLHSAVLLLLAVALSSSCSVLTKEDAAQCQTDGDCSARGFLGATCNVPAGVCVSAAGGTTGASGGGAGGEPASAGTGGLVNQGSAGSAGPAGSSSGGDAGMDNAAAGDAGMAGQAGAGTSPSCAGDCLDPVAVRLVESAPFPPYQPPGTLLGVEQFHADVCPRDQMLTGLSLSFGSDASSNKFLFGVQARCSVPSLSVTTPLTVILEDGATLSKRGSETNLVNTSLAQCPAGQIATGWGGIEDSAHISKFVLHCAPVTVSTNAAGVSTLVVGASADVAPFSGYDSAATPLAAQDCPAGFIARGINVRLSDALSMPQRLERFGFACGRPSLTFQTGAACLTDGDCDSGACSGHLCAATTCHPAAGTDCSCERLDTRDYLFCKDAVGFTQAAGQLGCGAAKMRLVKIDDGVENGWLFSTGLLHFPQGSNQDGAWIGATDSAQEGKWVWVDAKQTQFWQGLGVDQGGLAVNGLFSAWKRIAVSEEPNNGHGAPNPAENCGFLDVNEPGSNDDRWVDAKCADLRPYVCEPEAGQ